MWSITAIRKPDELTRVIVIFPQRDVFWRMSACSISQLAGTASRPVQYCYISPEISHPAPQASTPCHYSIACENMFFRFPFYPRIETNFMKTRCNFILVPVRQFRTKNIWTRTMVFDAFSIPARKQFLASV